LSHIVSIKTEVRDACAVRAACRRLNLPAPLHGTHRLFSGQATGLGVHLPEWKYLVVCDLASGQLRYDNFDGRWGDAKHLDAFLQGYAVEKSTHSQCTSCYGSCCLLTRKSALRLHLAL
jgi:hypothetical protein